MVNLKYLMSFWNKKRKGKWDRGGRLPPGLEKMPITLLKAIVKNTLTAILLIF